MFIVFDLDGTLADIDHRLHFVRRPPGHRDHDSFFRACLDDKPNSDVIAVMQAMIAAGHRVEIWSGRSDAVRAQTEEWLERHGVAPALLARMRPDGDHTDDVKLKREWLKSADQKPDMVFDDRQGVVDMWREENVRCMQVDAWTEMPRRHPEDAQPILRLLIGPSGAGKTTLIESGHPDIAGCQVLSSDDLRKTVLKDRTDQSQNDRIFKGLQLAAAGYMSAGIPVVVDATSMSARERKGFLQHVPAGNDVLYLIVDRPLDEKIRDGGWRNDVIVRDGVSLIQFHHDRFQNSLDRILRGDDLPHVTVKDLRKVDA